MQTGPQHENKGGYEDSGCEDVEGIPETAEIVPAMEFKILQDPRSDEDVQILLHELKRNQEYRFYITALGVGDIEEDILNLEMWSEFTSEIVKNVRGSLATTKSSLSRCNHQCHWYQCLPKTQLCSPPNICMHEHSLGE